MFDFSKDTTRALRRHHVARLKNSRAHYWGRSGTAEPLSPRQRGLVATTPAVCSGLCCGNPRFWLGERSMQERRWSQQTLSELLQHDREQAAASELF